MHQQDRVGAAGAQIAAGGQIRLLFGCQLLPAVGPDEQPCRTGACGGAFGVGRPAPGSGAATSPSRARRPPPPPRTRAAAPAAPDPNGVCGEAFSVAAVARAARGGTAAPRVRVCAAARADAGPVGAMAVAGVGAQTGVVARAGSGARAAGSWDRAGSPARARGDRAGRHSPRELGAHQAAAGCRPQQECTSTGSYCSQFRWPAANA